MEINSTYADGQYAIEREKERQIEIAKLTDEFEDRAITDPAQYAPKATMWLIDQFLPEGDSILAGASFVGKTYVLTNLVATMLDLVAHEGLVASRRRNIVWISEDCEQILQALSVLQYSAGKSNEDFHKGCLLIPAQRVQADLLGPVVANVIEARGWHEDHNPPLVIVDTMAASLECEDINNAAKASKLLASLRQCWRDYSILITMHTAKQGDSKEAMGSVAFKADMQNAFYVNSYEKGENMREVGYTKRRANGQIKRLITEQIDRVPQQLPDRDGDLVTEWIPLIRLIGQDSEAAAAWDEAHATEGNADGGERRKMQAKEDDDRMLRHMGDKPYEASSRADLARQLMEEAPDIMGAIATAKRRVGRAADSGRIVEAEGLWTVRSVDQDDEYL